ncbi:MAG: AAA family ATPase, partial [Campylobacterota bacterium]|nr:AAA family ATPase [Campylobacterota bacterium]
MKNKISKLLVEINKDIYEKEEVISLSVLSALAGESIFLLGSPGVAKSLISRRLKYIFKEASHFEYLMNKFSTPEEIFGPVSISKIQEDKYERKIEKYLPDSEVVFLDEIWKAGPSIQNSLLTVINEKVYRNGTQEDIIKLKSLISASNELPAKDEGLEALWDRFLVRYVVENIEDENNFFEMITSSTNADITIDETIQISDEEYNDIQDKSKTIYVPDEVKNTISVIRKYISKYNEQNKKDEEFTPIYTSDRRWKKIINILRTSAYLNGREKVDLMDCFLIVHMLWDEVE